MAEQDFERLLAIIRQLNQQLDQVRGNVERFSREFQRTGAGEFNRAWENQRVIFSQLANELAHVTNEYNRMKQAAQQAATTNIPHPPGATDPNQPQSIYGRFRNANSKNRPGVDVRDRGLYRPDPLDTVKKETEIARIERERVETLRATLASEKRYEQAVRIAERQGYSVENLKNIRTRGTGNINQLQFEKYNELGIKQNLDLFVNQGGKTTPGISNQFRTFGQGVVRDIGELTKWSLALAAVYGPLRKLGELTDEMIENQTRLADATVSVASAFLEQGEIFDIAADQAAGAGEQIAGVIDAFTQAYRATGGNSDQVERLSTAQRLLSDSLILSKLSSLDQASAIDTLSAALRQSGGDLTKGTELLDSWVRVTKVANVDLASLATGFAVLGDAAEAAQIGPDELNGILAALAETGVASGRELANTARAIVAGFQSDQAREELEALGIAVEDSTGQMRPFLDIMQEIHNLQQAGIIDETQFSRLSLALGGGTRRQAAYATFIQNFDRVFEVAQESSRASGDAEAALAKQLDTVRTSLTELGNAFTTLAQTMGTEGGFLGIIQASVENLTALVGTFDKLVGLLGKATPAMAAFVATSLVLKQSGRGGIQEALFGVGQGVLPDKTPYELINRLNSVTGGGRPPVLSQGDKFKQFVGNDVLGKSGAAGIFQGLALSALPAILNATNKDDRFGKVKAGADVVGGITGGLIGALVAGSPVIGAAIGVSISEAFVNATIARKTDIFGYAVGPTLGTAGAGGETDVLDKALKDAERRLYESIGFGNEGLGRLISSPGGKIEDAVEDLNDAIKSQDKGAINRFITPITNEDVIRRTVLQEAGVTVDLVKQAFQTGQPISVSPERYAYNLASEAAQKEYDKALAGYKAGRGETADVSTPFGNLVSQNKELYGELLGTIRESSKNQLASQRLSGDVTGAEYARRTTSLGGFDIKALQYYTALGDEFININKDIDNASEAFEAFNQIIVSGAGDSVPEITSIVGEIEKLINILNDPKLQDTSSLEKLGFKDIDQVRDRLQELQEVGANTLTDIYNQTRLSQLEIPEIQGDINKPLTRQEETLVEQRTSQLENQYYKEFLRLPNDMFNAIKDSFDTFAVPVRDFEDSVTNFQEVVRTDAELRQAAIAQLLEEGKLKSQETTPFGIQQLDITSQQGAGLQGQINYFSQYLAQKFPQYEQKPEEFGVIFSDYVTDVLHGDNLAVKLALEKLVDINQKQLDGMYNIPEGATFWVPLTAAYYRPQNQGGGGGVPSLDTGVVDTNTSAVDRNTASLDQLTLQIMGEKDYDPRKLAEDRASRAASLERQERAVQRFRGVDVGRGNPPPSLTGGVVRGEFRERGGADPQSWLEQIFTSIKNFFTNPTPGVGGPPGRGYGGGAANAGGGFHAQTPPAPQNLSARLDLRFDSSTQLIVDGRILASIITPYLASDLIKLEASQGTITKRYVI